MSRQWRFDSGESVRGAIYSAVAAVAGLYGDEARGWGCTRLENRRCCLWWKVEREREGAAIMEEHRCAVMISSGGRQQRPGDERRRSELPGEPMKRLGSSATVVVTGARGSGCLDLEQQRLTAP